jgi:predicted DNA binding protein
MSVQEMKVQIYQLVEHTDNELAVEQILQQAKSILANQTEPERDILDDLTPEQCEVLEQARKEGRAGQYTTLNAFKQEVAQWLKSA